MKSGSPRISRLFHRLFALVSLLAWLSLADQALLLVGSRGLVPMKSWLNPGSDLGFWDAPTQFWLTTSDGAIVGLAWVGVALSILALVGMAPRVMFALSTILYLGYATACRTFLAFQWDNLLLECGLLVLFLPPTRRAPLAHLAFRLLLFKLYFESGIAKSGSPIGDWWDGSAMSFYYETAPLPTGFAWAAHHLPSFWHSIESRMTLLFELLLPFFFFGPRRLRIISLIALTGFQLVNLATANYGFFVYLALALHVFLLDGRDIEVATARVDGWLARLGPPQALVAIVRRGRALRERARIHWQPPKVPRFVGVTGLVLYAALSLFQGLLAFWRPAREVDFIVELAEIGAALSNDQYLSPVRGDHPGPHRAGVSNLRRHELFEPRLSLQARRSEARPAVRGSASTPRGLLALVLRTRVSAHAGLRVWPARTHVHGSCRGSASVRLRPTRASRGRARGLLSVSLCRLRRAREERCLVGKKRDWLDSAPAVRKLRG